MRIIATNTIQEYWKKHPECEQALKAWVQEVQKATWQNPQELKDQYKSASVITGKRVVFNINGNRHRLLVDIEFRLQIIFIVWFGNHHDYDQVDAKKVAYDKTNKK